MNDEIWWLKMMRGFDNGQTDGRTDNMIVESFRDWKEVRSKRCIYPCRLQATGEKYSFSIEACQAVERPELLCCCYNKEHDTCSWYVDSSLGND